MDPGCVLNESQKSNRFRNRLKSYSQYKKSKNTNTVTKTERKIYQVSEKVNNRKRRSIDVSSTLPGQVKGRNRYYLAPGSFRNTVPMNDYSTTTTSHTSGKIPTI